MKSTTWSLASVFVIAEMIASHISPAFRLGIIGSQPDSTHTGPISAAKVMDQVGSCVHDPSSSVASAL